MTMVDSSPRSWARSRRCSATRTTPSRRSELDEVKKVLFDLKPHIVALHSSNYDTLIAKARRGWVSAGAATACCWRLRSPGKVRRRQRGRRDLDRLLQHPGRCKEPGCRARVDRLRLPAEEQRRRDIVHVLRLAAQAIAPEGNCCREAPQQPGGLPAARDGREARANQVTPAGKRLGSGSGRSSRRPSRWLPTRLRRPSTGAGHPRRCRRPALSRLARSSAVAWYVAFLPRPARLHRRLRASARSRLLGRRVHVDARQLPLPLGRLRRRSPPLPRHLPRDAEALASSGRCRRS